VRIFLFHFTAAILNRTKGANIPFRHSAK
jgi:hypothetical protein